MIYAIFDTETTGLPKAKIIEMDNLHLWPHIIQFSYILFDTETNQVIKIVDSIVKLDTEIIISEESVKLHGITKEISQKNGKNINSIIGEFFQDIKDVDLIIGHNLNFDLNMLKAELSRLIFIGNNEKKKYYDYFIKLEKQQNFYCTMQESIELCNIIAKFKNGDTYVKFPRLSELYETLFKETPKNLHNSLNDVIVTFVCFMKLRYQIDIRNNSSINLLMDKIVAV